MTRPVNGFLIVARAHIRAIARLAQKAYVDEHVKQLFSDIGVDSPQTLDLGSSEAESRNFQILGLHEQESVSGGQMRMHAQRRSKHHAGVITGTIRAKRREVHCRPGNICGRSEIFRNRYITPPRPTQRSAGTFDAFDHAWP